MKKRKSARRWRRDFLGLAKYLRERPHGKWCHRAIMMVGGRLFIPGVAPPDVQALIDHGRLPAANENRNGRMQ